MSFATVLATALVATGAAMEEPMKVPTDKSVSQAADALVAAIEDAGATTFLRVDHGKGARTLRGPIGDSQLIIFGAGPAGTHNADLPGMKLPLKVLVFEDTEGRVWLAYEDPAARIATATGAEIAPEITASIAQALETLTGAAAR